MLDWKKELQEMIDKYGEDVIEKCYRLQRAAYIYEDALYRIEDDEENAKHADNEGVAEIVAERYSFEGDYDCNLSYWENIDRLIENTLDDISHQRRKIRR